MEEASAELVETITEHIEIELARLGEREGIEGVSAVESERIHGFQREIRDTVEAAYAANPGVEFYHDENIPYLLEELDRCFISSNFTGFSSYIRLFGDSRFFIALGQTALFTAVSVFFEFVFGMAIALLMAKAMRGIGFIRMVALVPWAIPTAVSALMWSYLYDGNSGILAEVFYRIGIVSSPQSMLLSASGAMASIILADVWKTTPYMALLLLAGLQTIDRGLYESASIDGAGKIQTFIRITFPLLKPTVLVSVLLRTLDAFRVYDLIAVLTGGGPGGATESLSIYAYKIMIAQGNYGYGSVISVAMFACVALIAFVFIKVLGADLIGEGGA